MQRTMSFLAGVFAGAVVGAVSALLLAPMSGQELQSRARDQYDHVIEEAKQAAADRRAQLQARFDELKSPKTLSLESDE